MVYAGEPCGVILMRGARDRRNVRRDSSERPVMFGVYWLRGRTVVEKQTSELTQLADVIAASRRSARDVGARHPGNAPDTFKVFDGLGHEVGQYTLT
jgi:hypothetical protein